MKNLFSIGEVSKIKDITIKALRYYHKMGILIPKHIDNTTGYRYYSIEQFIHIDIIKCCRTLGTSIVELQEIFKESDTDKLMGFLEAKRGEAEENINKMKEVIKGIDNLSDRIEYSKDILNNENISSEFFEERNIIVAPCKEVLDLKELIYYSKLYKIIEEKKLKTSGEIGIMYTFDSKGNIEPSYVFSVLEENYNLLEEGNFKRLPKGRYLTLVYSKGNEEESISKIINYAKRNSLKCKGFIEVELFNDFFNTECYSCQIQIFLEGEE